MNLSSPSGIHQILIGLLFCVGGCGGAVGRTVLGKKEILSATSEFLLDFDQTEQPLGLKQTHVPPFPSTP